MTPVYENIAGALTSYGVTRMEPRNGFYELTIFDKKYQLPMIDWYTQTELLQYVTQYLKEHIPEIML